MKLVKTLKEETILYKDVYGRAIKVGAVYEAFNGSFFTITDISATNSVAKTMSVIIEYNFITPEGRSGKKKVNIKEFVRNLSS